MIMARCYAWIGHSRKDLRGDCIVANFNNEQVVRFLLDRIGSINLEDHFSKISLLPLGLFYRRHFIWKGWTTGFTGEHCRVLPRDHPF